MTNEKLSKDQMQALDAVFSWLKGTSSQPLFYLGGYAGTGKTTLAKEIVSLAQKDGLDNILILAPTGKAAEVLNSKGLFAQTIHSGIYRANRASLKKIQELRKWLAENSEHKDYLNRLNELNGMVNSNPSFSKQEKSEIGRPDLIVVDEFSMVGDPTVMDILDIGSPVLAIGDPGQLPPVGAKNTYTPNFVLDKVHRTAEDNPIIKLSMMARLDGFIPIGKYGLSMKIERSEYQQGMLFSHDQVICGTNKTRNNLNKRYRLLKGYDARSDYPLSGEKLICLKNDHARGLSNGVIGYAANDPEDHENDSFSLNLRIGEETYEGLIVYNGNFLTLYDRVTGRSNSLSWEEKRDFSELDYAYAITCHKSQGSEWDDVLLIEDHKWIRNEQERSKWLYTAVTRAKNRITIVETAR